ncbi:hypothetical protein ACSYAD_32000 [Acaryochloris marina NIES-2412]|uniref:hypothetical protein n=1 Tax=Acaryochloris marina TaxID=155978 RepID=UPI0040581E13
MHPDQERLEEDQWAPVSLIADGVDNPIEDLQELCHRQQISTPAYESEDLQEDFCCTVQATVLLGVG